MTTRTACSNDIPRSTSMILCHVRFCRFSSASSFAASSCFFFVLSPFVDDRAKTRRGFPTSRTDGAIMSTRPSLKLNGNNDVTCVPTLFEKSDCSMFQHLRSFFLGLFNLCMKEFLEKVRHLKKRECTIFKMQSMISNDFKSLEVTKICNWEVVKYCY